MATIDIANMQVVGTMLGVSTPTMHGFEAASQTWDRFDVLKLKSDGRIEAAVDDETTVSLSVGAIGIATADATGTTDADVVFEPFIPGVTLIEANLCEDNAGTAHVLAQTDFYVAYNVAVVSGKYILHVTSPGATTALAMPIRCAKGSAIGDSNARVIAVIVQSPLIRWGSAA